MKPSPRAFSLAIVSYHASQSLGYELLRDHDTLLAVHSESHWLSVHLGHVDQNHYTLSAGVSARRTVSPGMISDLSYKSLSSTASLRQQLVKRHRDFLIKSNH